MFNDNFLRWLYRGHKPNLLAKVMNRFGAIVGSTGLTGDLLVRLVVRGRKSGREVSLPIVLTVMNGQRYIVSMLGPEAQWTLNVRAAAGRAALVSRRREEVILEDVPVEQRAPIIKSYLKRAPGARPHMPINKDAPLTEFEKIAHLYPVFRIVRLSSTTEQPTLSAATTRQKDASQSK